MAPLDPVTVTFPLFTQFLMLICLTPVLAADCAFPTIPPVHPELAIPVISPSFTQFWTLTTSQAEPTIPPFTPYNVLATTPVLRQSLAVNQLPCPTMPPPLLRHLTEPELVHSSTEEPLAKPAMPPTPFRSAALSEIPPLLAVTSIAPEFLETLM